MSSKANRSLKIAPMRNNSSVRNVLIKLGDKKLTKDDHEVIAWTNKLVAYLHLLNKYLETLLSINYII